MLKKPSGMFPETLKEWLGRKKIEEVECVISDIAGVVRGKAMPLSKFDRLENVYMPSSIFYQTISGDYVNLPISNQWTENDMVLTPDFSTAICSPWAEDITVQVICDVLDIDGKPIEIVPRNVLKRVIGLYEQKGWAPIVAPEIEFYLTKPNLNPSSPIEPMLGRTGRKVASRQAYSMSAVDEYGRVIDDIYDFAEAQGFDKDLALAISEQYLPTGSGSRVPKKPFSIALSLADKIDTLVGFFGLNQKPTSSKDPYALRRLALGVIRIIVENKKDFKIKDLINYSSSLYLDQGFEIDNQSLQNELSDFLMDRLKYHMKEENIRNDIIQASTSSFNLDQSVIIFNKAKHLNKIINKPDGLDIIASYKRASNILDGELKNDKIELSNTTDPGIFKTELEKNLFKKISELRKYFSGINKDENYVQTLDNLASVKREVFDFFDNVIVNEDDPVIKKNRLELIQMMCKTFNNYVNFSLIDSH